MPIYRFFLPLMTSLLMLSPTNSLYAQTSGGLPAINESGFTTTPQEEYELGRTWVRVLKGSAKLYEDPVTVAYLEDLLWDVVEHSQLDDRRLELVVLDNSTLNAFAVPGGIVCIHTGLVQAAQSEDELASVIAHELAHLSQRHYAAQIDQQKRNRPLMLAALLGSVLVAAADSQGGVAAISSTMAASQASSLAFSRRNEREADHIGMQTLTEAGFDPAAMPKMFSRLQANARFGQKPPEFLLTHPVTQSRIADSLDRASRLPTPEKRPDAIDFELVQARINANYAKDLPRLLKDLATQQEKTPNDQLRYATAVAATHAQKYSLAQTMLDSMSSSFKQKLAVKLAQAELHIAQQHFAEAEVILNKILRLFPRNYPANTLYAELKLHQHQIGHALAVYRKLAEQRPDDVNIRYTLAEVAGLAGNTLEVHMARIEYFMLTGNIDLALRQTKFALRTPHLSATDQSKLKALEDEAKALRARMEKVL